jgi:hypothetical protein
MMRKKATKVNIESEKHKGSMKKYSYGIFISK